MILSHIHSIFRIFSDVVLEMVFWPLERPSPWRHVRANPENSALDLQNLTVTWNGLKWLGFDRILAGSSADGLDTHLFSNG